MATYLLQGSVEKLVAALEPRPLCIITSNALPWTTKVALKLNIPWFLFHPFSTFSAACSHGIASSGVEESVISDTEPFLVPDMPDRIEMTRAQMPDVIKRDSIEMKGAMDQIKEAELSAQGILVNSFDELEWRYTDVYRKLVRKVWNVGPVSLCDKEMSDKIDRGFLTYCGWNSVLEGMCAGVPMITWPMFAEQFYNENFIVNVLKIGVRIGAESTMMWAHENNLGVLVKKERVKKAIDQLMNEGEKAEDKRKRARELVELAKISTEEGGSSDLNMTLFIHDVLNTGNSQEFDPRTQPLQPCRSKFNSPSDVQAWPSCFLV